MKKYFLLIFFSFFKVEAGFKDILKNSSSSSEGVDAQKEEKASSLKTEALPSSTSISSAPASSTPTPLASSPSQPISPLKQFKAPQHNVNASFDYSGDDFESEFINEGYVVTLREGPVRGKATLSQDNLVLKASIIKIYIDKTGKLLKALAQKDVDIRKTYVEKERSPMIAKAQKIEYNATTGILFLEENVFLEWGCNWESQTLQVNIIQGNVQNIKGSGGFRSFCPQGGP